MYKRQFTLLLAVLATAPALLVAAPHLSVQVGAFRTIEEANAQSENARRAGAESVAIRKEETGEVGVFYKVLVGDFASRDEAEAAKAELAKSGLDGFIRGNASLDLAKVAAAIENGEADYFTTGSVVESLSVDTSLPANFAAVRAAALAGPTTAPETLKGIADYIALIPDTNPGKAREINMLGHRTMSGKSAQKSYPDSAFEPARSLMMQVANGEIAVRKQEQAEARALISHLLHYYDHDHINALKAYRQVLADQLQIKNLVGAAKTRSEIAGTCLELARKSGYDKNKLEPAFAELWQDNLNQLMAEIQQNDQASTITEISAIKNGLMLTELYLHQEKWQEAVDMSISLEKVFGDSPAAKVYLLESYTHRAAAGIYMNNHDVAREATDKALLTLGDDNIALWGATEHNVAWKIHRWRLGMMQKFRYPQEQRGAFQKYCYERFKELPNLAEDFAPEEDAR